MIRSVAAGLALILAPSLASAAYVDKRTAVLQGLDKITARVWTFEAPVGQAVRFGTLEIRVQACKSRPPEEQPEDAVFMDVIDHRVSGETVALFRGWMFRSSPALSAIEHPVYDVAVTDCK